MGARDKIFLDTDVVLDHLADRQPFAEYAHRLFALAETGDLTRFCGHYQRNLKASTFAIISHPYFEVSPPGLHDQNESYSSDSAIK